MKSINSFLIVVLVFIFYGHVYGQKIEFDTTSHDFGTVYEEKGPVEFSFAFTNKGDKPLQLLDVNASCGCTTPKWTRKPIPAGEKGMIIARYDPKNRPGTFNKTIRVLSNGSDKPTILTIKGIVESEPDNVEKEYPSKIGHIRTKYRSLNMGRLTTKSPVVKTFSVYNDSDEIIKFMNKTESPDYAQIKMIPPVLKPHKRGRIQVYYNPKDAGKLGFVSDPVKIYTNEKKNAMKDFRLMASITEYFPPLTKNELEQAPQLEVNQSLHNFGTVQQGDTLSTRFTLKNKGEKNLNIRQTEANCSCIDLSLEKENITKGDSTHLDVSFNTVERRGRQQKFITIFNNDPTSSSKRITIKAKIEADD